MIAVVLVLLAPVVLVVVGIGALLGGRGGACAAAFGLCVALGSAVALGLTLLLIWRPVALVAILLSGLLR